MTCLNCELYTEIHEFGNFERRMSEYGPYMKKQAKKIYMYCVTHTVRIPPTVPANESI